MKEPTPDALAPLYGDDPGTAPLIALQQVTEQLNASLSAGDIPTALACVLAARARTKCSGEGTLEPWWDRFEGLVRLSLGQNRRALDSLDRCRTQWSTGDAPGVMAFVWLERAEALERLGSLELSREAAELARELARLRGWQALEAAACACLGRVALQSGIGPAALAWTGAAQGIAVSIGDRQAMAWNALQLAEVNYRCGRGWAAILGWVKARRGFGREGLGSGVAAAWTLLQHWSWWALAMACFRPGVARAQTLGSGGGHTSSRSSDG